MTRVVVHIGQLVVHGGDAFATAEFRESLQREIGRYIAQGASATEIAQKLQGNASTALHGRVSGQRKPKPGPVTRSTERLVATEIAGRLLK